MRFGINRIVKYSDVPPYRFQRADYEFNENGTGKYIIELDKPFGLSESISKRDIIFDIVNGTFGCDETAYKWINKPSTINGMKKNHRKL